MSSELVQVKSGTVAARLRVFEKIDLERRPTSSASTLPPRFLRPVGELPFNCQQRAASSYVRPTTPLDLSAAGYLTRTSLQESVPNNTPNLRTSPDPSLDPFEGCLPESESGTMPSCSSDLSTDVLGTVDSSYHGLRIQNRPLDGTAEFSTIRSKLRSMSRSKINHDNSAHDKLMLNELDNLLQDAIDEHRSDDGISTTTNHTNIHTVSESRPSTSASTSKESSLPFGEHFQNPFQAQANQPTNTHVNKVSSYHLESPAMPSFTSAYTVDSSPSVTPRRLSSVHYCKDEGALATVKAGRMTQLEQGSEQNDLTTRVMSKISPHPFNDYVFPRYLTSPVKQRAEFWEALYQEPPKPDPACRAPHSDVYVLKESLPQQANGHVEKQVKQMRQISHRPIPPGIQEPNACLIPLRLPASVAQRPQPNADSDDLLNEDTDRFSTARQSYGDISPIPENELNLEDEQMPQKAARSVSRETHLSTTTNSIGSDSNTGHQMDISDTQNVKRQSVVQSKIRELMAFAQSTGSTPTSRRSLGPIDRGHVKHNMKENIRQRVSAASLASVHLPCKTQRNSYVNESIKSESILQKSDITSNEAVVVGDTLREASNIVRASPATPVCGRSQKLKQSMSPRGSPFAIEQKFNLTPNRSSSRGSRGVVRLNVELRSSPERALGAMDSHVLILRAGIDAESEED